MWWKCVSVVDSLHDISMTLKLAHRGKSVTSQPPLVKLRELVPTTLRLARFNHVHFWCILWVLLWLALFPFWPYCSYFTTARINLPHISLDTPKLVSGSASGIPQHQVLTGYMVLRLGCFHLCPCETVQAMYYQESISTLVPVVLWILNVP